MAETLWEKEKLLVTSNFSFSHSVFRRLVSQGRQKVSLCWNGLTYALVIIRIIFMWYIIIIMTVNIGYIVEMFFIVRQHI